MAEPAVTLDGRPDQRCDVDFIGDVRVHKSTLLSALSLGGRPAIAGAFKTLPNQAGMRLFVDPALVEGNLREAWRRLAELDTAWERAVYTMFLVSEVHPFTDGNGRIARVMMNAELVAGHQSKIIVPTGCRIDYLSALHRLSRDDDPSVYVKALRFLHDYTAQINWTTHDTAEADLRTTYAFEETDDAPRLRLLRPVPPARAEWPTTKHGHSDVLHRVQPLPMCSISQGGTRSSR